MQSFVPGRRARRGRLAAAAVVAVAAALLAGACAPRSTGGTPSPVTAVPSYSGFMMVANRAFGFFSLPWPNDIRKYASGGIDMRGLPGIARNVLVDPVPPVPFLADSISKASLTVDDFGTNTGVFFQSNVDIDPATLPADADATLSPSATAMLIDLDHGYARHPVIPVWEPTGDRYSPNRLLTLVPYPGHPLLPGTNYAAVLFTGITDATGTPLEPAPLIGQLAGPWDETRGVNEATWTALQAQRETVGDAVVASTAWSATDIAAFTVYRTQETSTEIDAIAAELATLPAPQVTVTAQAPCAPDTTVGGNGALNSLVTGQIALPDFQHGYFPYTQSGGNLVIAEDGTANVARTRNIPVRLRVPCGEAPAGGWPSIGHVGALEAVGNSDTNPPPYRYGGYVFAEIPAHMAGATSSTLTNVGIAAADQPGLLYANFINPAAGRANPLQQAADHLGLLRALEGFTLDGATVGSSVPVTTDPAATMASGHSQGAWTLPFVASKAAGLEAVYSSSGSGGQYHSLAHTFQRDSLALFTADADPLDELNPLVQLVQTVTEASDGINVGAAALPDGLHYLNVTGAYDGCVALEASRHFATAMGLPVARKAFPSTFYGSTALDPQVTALPVAGNGPGGATRVQLEGNGDHEQALANISLGTGVLASVAAGVAPTVPDQTYQNTYGVCGYRWDFLGGDPFGRV